MIPYQAVIDKYFESGSRLREILIHHSRQVADLALSINANKNLGLDADVVEAAAMLHDIGIFLTNAPGIECRGDAPYLQHGILGAALLRKEGLPETIARVAERHTGAGITVQDIQQQSLPLPLMDYKPETILEKLICYADKFYSKSSSMKEKPYSVVKKSMEKFGQDTVDRFEELHKLFD